MKKLLFTLIIMLVSAPTLKGGFVVHSSSNPRKKVNISVAHTTPEMSAKRTVYQHLFDELARLRDYRGRIEIVFMNDSSEEYSGNMDKFMVSYERVYKPAYPKRNSKKKRDRKLADGKNGHKDIYVNSLIVRQNWGEIDLDSMLKLADYAMTNAKKIKRIPIDTLVVTRPWSTMEDDGTSKPVTNEYISRKISQETISDILGAPMSREVSETMDIRIRRRVISYNGKEEQTQNGVSYYWNNGKYHIYLSTQMDNDAEPLFVWDDVYCISYFPETKATLLFKDPRTFYCVRDGKLSREQKNADPLFYEYFNYTFDIIDSNTICMRYLQQRPDWINGKPAFMRYLIDEDKLIMSGDENEALDN